MKTKQIKHQIIAYVSPVSFKDYKMYLYNLANKVNAKSMLLMWTNPSFEDS